LVLKLVLDKNHLKGCSLLLLPGKELLDLRHGF